MSTTGKATLFVINPANGAKVAEIDTGTGSAASPNGLTSPTPVDTNGDGKVDYLYAATSTATCGASTSLRAARRAGA